MDGMHLAKFALCEKEINVRDVTIPSKTERYVFPLSYMYRRVLRFFLSCFLGQMASYEYNEYYAGYSTEDSTVYSLYKKFKSVLNGTRTKSSFLRYKIICAIRSVPFTLGSNTPNLSFNF